MDVKLLYNPDDWKFRSVGEKMLEWEPCPSRGWAPRPPTEQPRRTGKKCCYSRKSWGQYVAVFVWSPAHLSHTTLSIKWEVYFSKELCPLVVIVSSLCFCTYICRVGHGYTSSNHPKSTIKQITKTVNLRINRQSKRVFGYNIIIMSCLHHGYPWSSSATSSSRAHPVSAQNCCM